MLFSFFWVIPRSLNFVPTFRNTLFHLHMYTTYDGGADKCSKTSALKIQTPGNHPKERMQHSEPSESL